MLGVCNVVEQRHYSAGVTRGCFSRSATDTYETYETWSVIYMSDSYFLIKYLSAYKYLSFSRLFGRCLLLNVDASYKEKIGDSGEADEQTRKIAERKIVHAEYRFIRYPIDDTFAALCHLLGYIYRC